METKSVLFAGVGGQGIILASKILAKCAFNSGFMVKESELHGMAQRGGSVVSHVRFGDQVHSPLIPSGQSDYLVSMEELEGLRYTYYLKPESVVIYNVKQIIPPTINPEITPYPEDAKSAFENMGFHVDEVNAPEIAREAGNPKTENIVLLGALSNYLPFSLAEWENTVAESVPAKFRDINLLAFHKGREITQN
jgi:indolepyruvate ferredoxin oxidoreductase beta subunit